MTNFVKKQNPFILKCSTELHRDNLRKGIAGNAQSIRKISKINSNIFCYLTAAQQGIDKNFTTTEH